MPLPYAYIDWTGPVPVPPRAVNGGLYTGKPFAAGAPWGNVPVEPEPGAYALHLKATGAPPPTGETMMPFGVRPGNNAPAQIFHEPLDPMRYPGLMCRKKD